MTLHDAVRRHRAQVAIKRTLYTDERTLAPNAGSATLQQNLDLSCAALSACVQERIARDPAQRGTALIPDP